MCQALPGCVHRPMAATSYVSPETHFLGQSQPLGIEARATLLKWLGFNNVNFNETGSVVASQPPQLAVTIFVGLLDPYGRPVSYVLPGVAAEYVDGSMVALDTVLLSRTANVMLLQTGAAYAAVYSSTPAEHRLFLFAQAQVAQDQKLGVWALDTTASFTLAGHDSIDAASGVLIFPKMFRRATSYIRAVAAGYTGTFSGWIESTMTDPYHSADDFVIRAGGKPVRLHTLVHDDNGHITTDLDLLHDVFIEQ